MSQKTQSNNKRIAKNTMFLYIRMFIMMAVGLFTSRIVLAALGTTDYGIYNIIGGIVVLFSFLNQALTAATRRFMNFYLGKEEFKMVNTVFCMSMNTYIILSIIFLITAETIGLWFVNSELNIPLERMQATNWCYQFCIVTFIFNLIRIPYNATIISNERMNFYAYISLVEVLLKLLVVYVLYMTNIDRLIIYAFLYTFISFIMNISYQIYCRKEFVTTKYNFIWDSSTFKKLFNFSSWSLFGSMANMLSQQGLNILINIFFGVTINAAVGVANQVSSQVYQFITNFQTAFHPQIDKNYAAGNINEYHKLIFSSSKFSFYLIFLLSLPVILTADTILNIWLIEVPKFTAVFCRLILGYMIIETITAPLWMAVQATGVIKRYQIWMSLCLFLNFPLAFIIFKLGYPAYSAWIIRILVSIITFIVRCIYLNIYMNFPVRHYLYDVLRPILLTILFSAPVPLIVTLILGQTVSMMIIVVVLSITTCSLCIYTIGLKTSERELIRSLIIKRIHHNKN